MKGDKRLLRETAPEIFLKNLKDRIPRDTIQETINFYLYQNLDLVPLGMRLLRFE